MKITRCETFICGNPWKNWLFTRVHTDTGLYGIGEGTLHGFAKTVEAAITELSPYFLGRDPFDVEQIVLRMGRDIYSDGGQIHGCAIAAIEIACWDIMGKATGKPVYALMGGRGHERVRAYANGWYRGDCSPKGFAQAAAAVVKRGYTALKFDPFGAAWMKMRLDAENLSIEIVKAVREAVGRDVDVLIEGHNRFTAEQALRIARRLEPYTPTWFETPVPPQNISAMVEVARHSPVPIACGEDYTSRQQFAELLRHDVVHILQPEPLNLGGLSVTKQVAALAAAHYGVICPHSAQGPVSTAACAHLNLSCPNAFLHECFDDFNVENCPWQADLLHNPIVVKEGFIDVPERPGLGIDLNLDVIAQHPYKPSNAMHLFNPGWEKRIGGAAAKE
jgi:galactonate dehydratase